MKTEQSESSKPQAQGCKSGAQQTTEGNVDKLGSDTAVDMESFELDNIEEIESKVFA